MAQWVDDDIDERDEMERSYQKYRTSKFLDGLSDQLHRALDADCEPPKGITYPEKSAYFQVFLERARFELKDALRKLDAHRELLNAEPNVVDW